MSLVDQAETIDAAQAPAAQRRGGSASGRHPREGPRHLADLHLARLSRPRARLRARAGGAGLQARRQALGGRRQPPAALLGAARGPGAGRHVGAGLPGFDRQRAGLRAEPRRGVGDRGRGPGAGRQGRCRSRTSCRSCAGSSTTTRAACAPTTIRSCSRSTSVRGGGRATSARRNPDYYRAELDQGRRRRHRR